MVYELEGTRAASRSPCYLKTVGTSDICVPKVPTYLHSLSPPCARLVFFFFFSLYPLRKVTQSDKVASQRHTAQTVEESRIWLVMMGALAERRFSSPTPLFTLLASALDPCFPSGRRAERERERERERSEAQSEGEKGRLCRVFII